MFFKYFSRLINEAAFEFTLSSYSEKFQMACIFVNSLPPYAKLSSVKRDYFENSTQNLMILDILPSTLVLCPFHKLQRKRETRYLRIEGTWQFSCVKVQRGSCDISTPGIVIRYRCDIDKCTVST